ncbi:MAG: guanylate kinase [Kiritimatiellia bacterium]
MAEKPLLIVVSGPSGTGKTTLCERLMNERNDIDYSVSCTTRPPRGDEEHGRDYVFVTDREFDCMSAEGRFLEQAVVYGYKYGTPESRVMKSLSAGRNVLMDIDVQGAAQVRRRAGGRAGGDLISRSFVDIFVLPPSTAVLRERLTGRGEDARESIERRMADAEKELARADQFQYVIVNDSIDIAYERMKEILRKEAQYGE